MTNSSKISPLLRPAYLNGNYRAVFEALNISMKYLPYALDNDDTETVDGLPVWVLQALREALVIVIENQRTKNLGPKPQDHMKFLANYAKGLAEQDKKHSKGKVKLYDRAQDYVVAQGQGMGPETIKKYATEFRIEDLKEENFGKYFGMGLEDQAIFEDISDSLKEGTD